MLGILGNEGYAFTDDEQEADIIVINTCCFINDAKEESINTIFRNGRVPRIRELQSADRNRMFSTALSGRNRKEIPQVDAILGTNSYDAIAEAVKMFLGQSL